MSPRKRVYLAGPMRGILEFNFPAFDKAADEAFAQGWLPVSPADLDREMGFDEKRDEPSPADLRTMIIRDVVELSKCDAIALLPGWERSSGVAVELAVAKFLGLQILDAEMFMEKEV